MKRYEVIDHTADIGIKAYGKDLKSLFVNAAYAMFDILADVKKVRAKKKLTINLKAPNLEELFLSWLSELLYQYNSKKIIFKEFLIDKLTENLITAEVQGEKLDFKRHRLKTEIKAVTYHQMEIVKKPGEVTVKFILDI